MLQSKLRTFVEEADMEQAPAFLAPYTPHPTPGTPRTLSGEAFSVFRSPFLLV
jgi:hypothetical protein